MSQDTRRKLLLDGSRGVAALGVVAYHTSDTNPGSILSLVGYWAVDYFFALSGFILFAQILRDTNAPRTHFIKRRILRIWPLVLIILVVAILNDSFQWLLVNKTPLDVHLANPPFDQKNPVGWILALLLVQAFSQSAWWWWGPLWSLSVEWFMNLLAVCLRRMDIYRVSLCAFALGAIMFGLPSTGLPWTQAEFFNDLYSGSLGLSRGLMAFFPGLALGQFLSTRTSLKLPWKHASLTAIGVSASGVALLNFLHLSALASIATSLSALSVVTILSQADEGPLSERVQLLMGTLGRLSFGIYLWHFLFAGWVCAGARMAFGEPAGASGVALQLAKVGVTFALSISAAHLSFVHLEPQSKQLIERIIGTRTKSETKAM